MFFFCGGDLVSFTQHNYFEFHTYLVKKGHFFLLSMVWIFHSLSLHLLVDICVYIVWLLWTKLLCTFVYKSLYGHNLILKMNWLISSLKEAVKRMLYSRNILNAWWNWAFGLIGYSGYLWFILEFYVLVL